MSLQNEQERRNTQMKLDRLSQRLRSLSAETGGDAELRELTIHSLNCSIKELLEEIEVYDAHRRPVGHATHP
jgi:hypothetical protein